jgi:hypothetical protein
MWSLTIQPEALLRYFSTSILSSTVLYMEEWLVHMNLKTRLDSLINRSGNSSFPGISGMSSVSVSRRPTARTPEIASIAS